MADLNRTNIYILNDITNVSSVHVGSICELREEIRKLLN